MFEKEAEEYFKSVCEDYNEEKERTGERHYWVGYDLKNAFLAGLKAKTQWHDLRKNPDDLPEEPNEKMKVNKTWVYVKFSDNTYGLVDKGALKNYKGAIAWCELPIFEEQE